MKYFSSSILFLFVITSGLFAQRIEKFFPVSGVCGMCKKKIEAAAISGGAQSAEWDISAKMIKVAYDSSAVSIQKIQSAIAEAGYDNEGGKASDAIYEGLHECCKYREAKTTEGKACCGKKKQCNKKACKDGASSCKSESHEASCKKEDKAGCCKEGKRTKGCCSKE
jgi:mercuric ion binding protein